MLMAFMGGGARKELSMIGGPFTAMVSPSTNGTLIPAINPTSGTAYLRNGVRLYPNGGTITYTIAPLNAAPTSAPSPTSVVSGAAGTFVDENLAADQGIYVTATSGSPFYRLM